MLSKKISATILLIFSLILTGCSKMSVETISCIENITEEGANKLNKVLNKNLSLSEWCSLTELKLPEGILPPKEIWNLTNLTILILYNNQLTTLPKEIGNLTNLIGLNLARNKLTILPKEIGKLTMLNKLQIPDNQLITLPKEIGNLTNLTELILNDNQLISLPSEIGKLNNLTYLYLDRNQLTSLPSEMGSLTNLARLYLMYNNGLSPMDKGYTGYSIHDERKGNMRIRYNESTKKVEIKIVD
ncbi:MAG: leucine-rich repeat domain-containing protein [Candidatus Gracilibacteria bacterium]|nr:leucine-rich repeat domain-containing protein [Candidatus Gracilibacteria bacterium]